MHPADEHPMLPAKAGPASEELREHHPAANPALDTYTMLKFYSLKSALVKSVLDGLNDEDIDFPFRVSPSEQRIIELDSPSSIILVGEIGGTAEMDAAEWIKDYRQRTQNPK